MLYIVAAITLGALAYIAVVVRLAGVMHGHRRVALLVLSLLIAGMSLATSPARVQSIRDSAGTDNYRVWITLLKGFGKDVFHVGSDNSHAYFRIGRVFRSYYKIPSCAAHLPETYSLLEGVSYPLGDLDRA